MSGRTRWRWRARSAMRRALSLAWCAGAIALAGALTCAGAAAAPYLPPRGHIFAGLSGGTSLQPFTRMVGKHPPVFEAFMTWDTPTAWLAARRPGFRSRLALHIGTSDGYGRPGVIAPAQIAAGLSDRFLVALGRNLARSRRIVYIRLMAEMNGYWNAYAAFNADGVSRGAQNAPSAYVQAWRRSVLILRGGPVGRIDARLRGLGLPPIARRAVGHARRLPRPRVAFLWVPQDAGSPEIAANAPSAYWPGTAYVDWVGTDFYASYPDFTLLNAFYRQFTGKPFVISEWAEYGSDQPAFIRRLFAWVHSHRRVRMLNYYQGFSAAGKPNLAHYPRSRRALRRVLRSRVFLAYPPEYAHPPHRHRRGHHHRHRHPSGPPLPPVQGQPPNPPTSPPPPQPLACVPLTTICVPAV